MKRQKSLLLRGTRQLNRGAVASGVVFLLYIGASALELGWAADAAALAAGAVSLYVFLSAAAERRRDKEAASLNLLWGQGALTLLSGMCVLPALREMLGL